MIALALEALVGRGTLAEMALAPAPWEFGALELGSDPATQLFTITSSASAPFQLGAVSVDNGAFTVTRVDPASYPAAIEDSSTSVQVSGRSAAVSRMGPR